jgi:hypothetical protein
MADPFSFALMTIAQIGISYLFPSEGPRLRDLKITASTYGAAIAETFGVTRVAGNMIWSMPIQEHKKTQSSAAGKGGAVNTYKYTCSFAMGFCKGPVADIRRLWCDGKLIYDVTTPGRQTNNQKYTLRFYYGDEDQFPDGLIEDDRGAGNAPAYRGLCYIVFQDMPLEDFGNRIPQMTAEVYRDGNADSISPSASLVYSNYDAGTSYQLNEMRADPYNGYIYVGTTGGLRRFNLDEGTEDLYVSNGQMKFYNQSRSLVNNDDMNLTGIIGVKQDGNLVIQKGGAWCAINILEVAHNYKMGHFDGYINIFGEFPPDAGDPLEGTRRYTACLSTTDESAMCITNTGEEFVGWVGTLGELYVHNTIDTHPNDDNDPFRRGGWLVGHTDTDVPRGGILCGSYGIANAGEPVFFRALNTGGGIRLDKVIAHAYVTLSMVPPTMGAQSIQWMSFDQVDPGVVLVYAVDNFNMRITKYSVNRNQWVYDLPLPNVDAGSVYGRAPVFLNGQWGFVSTTFTHTTLWLLDTTTGQWITRSGQRITAFEYETTDTILESTQTTYAGIPVQEPAGELFTETAMQFFDPIRMCIFCLGGGYGSGRNQIVHIQRSPAQPTTLGTIVSVILQEAGLSPGRIDMSRLDVVPVIGYGWARGTDVKSVLDDLKRVYLFDIVETSGQLVGHLRGQSTNEAYFGPSDVTNTATWTAGVGSANQITLTAGDTVSGVSFSPASTSPTTRVIGLLFRDNAGVPGALIAKTGVITGVTSGKIARLPFQTAYRSTKTGEKLWIGIQADTANFTMNTTSTYTPKSRRWTNGSLGAPANPPASTTLLASNWTIYGYNDAIETIPQAALGSSSSEAADFWQETRVQEAEVPSQVTLSYMNYANNFETALARSVRISNPIPTMYSRQIVAIESTLVMEPLDAKARTDAILYTQWAERTKHTTRLPWSYLNLDPADLINVQMNDGRLYFDRIDRTEVGADFVIATELFSQDNGAYSVFSSAADGGGNGIPPTIALATPARSLILNTPLLRDQDDTGGSYSLFYAGVASTTALQFGGAMLYESSDDVTFNSIGGFDNDAEWGVVMNVAAPPQRGWYALDWDTQIVVWPMVSWFDLQPCTDDELWAGATPAWSATRSSSSATASRMPTTPGRSAICCAAGAGPSTPATITTSAKPSCSCPTTPSTSRR